jgi:DNA polymerase-3 subunit gamma/tau
MKRIEEVLANLRRWLKGAFAQSWQVELSDGPASPSLREKELAAEQAVKQAVLDTPLVKAALEAFPGAELAGYSLDDQRSA